MTQAASETRYRRGVSDSERRAFPRWLWGSQPKAPQSLEVMAFSRAVDETARHEREGSTRRGLLVRVAGTVVWLAFTLAYLTFNGRPWVAASLPLVAAYAALSLVVAAALWRSTALLRSWTALPLLDAPAVGAIAWRLLPHSSSPVGVAGMALGTFFVLLIAAQLSFSSLIVWSTAAVAVLGESALLWRAGLPEAIPFADILLALGAWQLLHGPRQVRALFSRLVREHVSLERFGRFYSPSVGQRTGLAAPGASADDVQVTLVFAELHLPVGVADPFRSSADLEEAIASFDAVVAPLILRHGGTPDHAASGGLQLYFLRTTALGEDGTRAVRCALEMAAALGPLNHRREQEGRPPVTLGLGVHAGWAAIDRSEGPGELIALGNAVGVAALLARRSWTSGAPVLASTEARVRAVSGFSWASAGDDAFVVGVEPGGRAADSGARRLSG